MFNGHIPYTPLVVDDFTSAPVLSQPNTALAFFLTHYHKDHIRGLTPTFNRGTIYTTKVTRALLLIDLPRLRPLLHTIELEEKTTITLTSAGSGGSSETSKADSSAYTFHVTAFDANHCPGAVILLFHLPTTTTTTTTTTASYRTLLHTGDMRYDPLRFHSPLLLSSVNHIDTLYLDCTFFHPTAALFPTKTDSIRLVQSVIGNYFKRYSEQYNNSKAAAYYHPLLHPRVYIAADMLGTEEILLSLHAFFNHNLYVPKEWDRYRQLSLLKKTLPIIINEQWNTPFTICKCQKFQQFKYEMETKRKMANSSIDGLYIKPSAMWFVRLSEQRKGGKMQSQSTTIKSNKPKHESTMGASTVDEVDVEAEVELDESPLTDSDWIARDSSGVVHVLWSMHSAMSECLHFIQLLQPRFIVPINYPASLTSLGSRHRTDSTTVLCSDTTTTDTASSSSDGMLLTRKRRSSSTLYSTTASIAERDRLVVTSLQRYIDSLLPHKRIVVRSPITAAEAEAKAAGELEARVSSTDVVPDTPPMLQGVKRRYSSPCKLQSISEVGLGVKVEATKAEVVGGGVGGGKVEAEVKAESSGSRVSRVLFGTVATASSCGSGIVARAHSSLLVVREEMDRKLLWHGAGTSAAATTVAAAGGGAGTRAVKDERAVDDMPSLTRE